MPGGAQGGQMPLGAWPLGTTSCPWSCSPSPLCSEDYPPLPPPFFEGKVGAPRGSSEGQETMRGLPDP